LTENEIAAHARPHTAVLAVAERCPNGLLGKLACVSSEFRRACEDEASRRDRDPELCNGFKRCDDVVGALNIMKTEQ
jgi:hypothetical protein